MTLFDVFAYFLVIFLSVSAKNEIVVRIKGGPLVAELLAIENGYFYHGLVMGFENTYIFTPYEPPSITIEMKQPQKRSRNHQIHKDQRVLWVDEQHIKERQKRDFSDIPLLRTKRNDLSNFNDELWNQQWYLRDTRTRLDVPKLDLNVLPVYRAGITGKGVRISILDDGIEYTHEDLSPNYDPEISYNCNENINDPMPRYESMKLNSHGTRCAGEVAMVANNKKCGVGIAYNAKIGGVKMLDGLVTDRIEGTALSYAQHLVDIYSASWGPNDDGKTVDGPGRLAKEAMENGVTKGRNGKGVIYVWASGNGGNQGDNCNCDGYLASIYTISIGSASQKGEFPWYGEACASTLAVTYSSGAYKDQMITTTDLNNECTIKHTGTSASAPLAAGIIALALEANPELTWRDVQHLIVWTAELAPLVDNPGWQINAAGLWFSNKFGFGLMNAAGMVQAAANWTNVPTKHQCINQFDRVSNSTILFGNYLELYAVGCKDVAIVEHAEVEVSINYSIRGSLDVYLTSPAGTRVQLLAPRQFDNSPKGFQNWTFMSVMTWGELSEGVWILTVGDHVGPTTNVGTILDASLILHGTKEPPVHMYNGPRSYNENYNRIHNRFFSNYEYFK